MFGRNASASSEVRFVLKGTTVADRWRLLRMLGYTHFRVGRLRTITNWLPEGDERRFDVSLRGGPDLRLRNTDVVFAWVCGAGEYDLDYTPLGDVKTILDLGGNVGIAAIYLAERLAAKRVVSVEPTPDSYGLLEQNLKRNLTAALAINAAVVAEPGSLRVEPGVVPAMDRMVPGESDIETVTIPELLDRAGLDQVDLLKIDIEGGEAQLFERAEDWGPRVRAILAEVHPPLTRDAAVEMLCVQGFVPLPVPDEPYLRDIMLVHRPVVGE